MKLLFDEMYPPRLAEQLRRRGHDALAASERKELRGLTDAALFAVAQVEGRALVTENVRDFVPLADATEARGGNRYGLILVHPGKFPRANARTIGSMVGQLVKLLTKHPGDELLGLRLWL